MRILIDPIAAKDKAVYAQVAEAIKQRQRGVMLMTVYSAEHVEVKSQWFLEKDIPSDAAFPGTDQINSCLARESVQLFAESSENPKVITEVLVEPVIPKPLLIIAGGGHVGQAVALQASLPSSRCLCVSLSSESYRSQYPFPIGSSRLQRRSTSLTP